MTKIASEDEHIKKYKELQQTICRKCDGTGEICYVCTWWDDNADEHPVICPDCKGTGRKE
jgi:DnaJ-class molecular chaperone